MTDVERYADKIAKLLRKAESTDSSDEAEALVAKAQELMTQYAIDEALIAQARGDQSKVAEEIVEEKIRYTGVYSRALFNIGQRIAEANNCRVLMSKGSNFSTLYVVGFQSDVDRVKLLDASIQIQATAALSRWARDNIQPYYSAMDKYKERRTFLFGFAEGVGQKLVAARIEGEKQAATSQTLRANVTQAQAVESVALVVRTRKEQVQDWYDQKYGRVRNSRGTSYLSGSGNARGAGRTAGSTADTGQPRVGGRGKELGQ